MTFSFAWSWIDRIAARSYEGGHLVILAQFSVKRYRDENAQIYS